MSRVLLEIIVMSEDNELVKKSKRNQADEELGAHKLGRRYSNVNFKVFILL